MNSSGIVKKGLAASAISALAITGVPALSTSASAAPGDPNPTVVSTGPALNGGTEGAVVVIRALDSVDGPFNVTSASSDTAGSEDTGSQTVGTATEVDRDDDPSNTAFDLITLRIPVFTNTVGSTATFRVFEDDANADTLDANEPRVTVAVSTAGELARIDVSPASQSAPVGVESGDYTITLQDAQGRTTQITGTETVTVGPSTPAGATLSETVFTQAGLATGTATFTATGTDVETYTIPVASPDYDGEQNNAVLQATRAAEIDFTEVDIVTEADSFDGPGDEVSGGTTVVRVDQNTIRFDFSSDDADDAGGIVTLLADGDVDDDNTPEVTFNGAESATYTTTLDSDGNGSITVTVDAGSIQVGDDFLADVNNGEFTQTIDFDQATAATATVDGEAPRYFCVIDGACTVTAVVTDQFGNPFTSGEVSARRIGPSNIDAPAAAQRKPVGADGTVDFTFTDVSGFNGSTDTVRFEFFTDQFDNAFNDSDQSTVIEYSPTGQGNDFVISLDGDSTEVPGYSPDDAAVVPLSDTEDDGGDESTDITIANGESNQPVTLSVDGGALILEDGEDRLSEGSASVDAELDVNGNLIGDYRVIGTTSGLVTLTVTSANRTETAQLTVLAQEDPSSARNVTVSGPAEVDADEDQIVYTAVVTDAFGNPVAGLPAGFLNVQVTGPGELQDSDAVSNANGQINFNVDVDEDAQGSITIRVEGVPSGAFVFGSQFGAGEDELTATDDDGEGLPASMNVATATTTVLPPEVDGGVTRTVIEATLDGRNIGPNTDKLKVTTTPAGVADTARVNLFRINKNGTRVLVESSELNAKGIKRFQVVDTNGKKNTRYVARVKRTDDSTGVKATNFKRIK